MTDQPASDPAADAEPAPETAAEQPTKPALPTAPVGDGLPSSDERTLALIAHGLTFVEGGIIGPLVVYLAKKDDSSFVAFHALQSLYFGLLAAVIIVPAAVLTCGMGAVLVVPYFVFEVIACVEANKGSWYELPIVGSIALRSHHP